MSDTPERIWLARAWANTFTTYDDREQCCEYVREDLHTALQARLAEVEALVEAIDRYTQTAEAIGGCGDGGCVIHRPGGQHTNGGCRCTYRMDETRQREVTKLLLLAQGIIKARAALAAMEGRG